MNLEMCAYASWQLQICIFIGTKASQEYKQIHYITFYPVDDLLVFSK